jgi:hypothetical protein
LQAIAVAGATPIAYPISKDGSADVLGSLVTPSTVFFLYLLADEWHIPLLFALILFFSGRIFMSLALRHVIDPV